MPGAMGRKFAAKGLLLSPGIAQMYTTGEIAANICLETPGLDTLDILVLWKGFPTTLRPRPSSRSSRRNGTISSRTSTRNGPLTRRPSRSTFPASTGPALAVPWGGTGHPVWFKDDPRVANFKALRRRSLARVMEGVVATVKMFEEGHQAAAARRNRKSNSARSPRRCRRHAAARKSESQPSLDSVHASGPLGRVHCVIHGNSNYKQTGLLQAYAAYSSAAEGADQGWLCLRLPGVRAP